MTYVERARTELLSRLDDGMVAKSEARLLDLYTVLVLTVGAGCTLRNVHDAWAVARQRERPDHGDLVPFEDLPDETKRWDMPFRDAVVAAAVALKVSG